MEILPSSKGKNKTQHIFFIKKERIIIFIWHRRTLVRTYFPIKQVNGMSLKNIPT
jgi:hypothetical protein